VINLKNQNDRQRNNNGDNDGGIMDKIGQAIENVVDTVTGDNQNNGQQGNRKRNNQ
jgi:hypothetical protein